MACKVDMIFADMSSFSLREGCTFLYDANNELHYQPSDFNEIVTYLELVGEFAFLGVSEGRYFVATDYSASRPLYYSSRDGSIIASTRLGSLPEGEVKVLPPSSILFRDGSIVQYTSSQQSLEDLSASRLLQLLHSSLVKRVGKRDKIAIAFSGGLDSSLLAFLCKDIAQVELFCVSTHDGNDIVRASLAAGELNLPLTKVSVNGHQVSGIIHEMTCKRICHSKMDYSLAVGFILASKEASKKGYDMLVSGQGADELFGGYKKYTYASSASVENIMNNDLKNLYIGLSRDSAAIFEGGCRPSFPYMDRNVVEFAKKIPVDRKVNRHERKIILREAASMAGLPESIVKSEKKAFQYGSGISRLVERLTFSNR